MRFRLALAGSRHANETRFAVQLGKIRRAEITHAALDAADELREDTID